MREQQLRRTVLYLAVAAAVLAAVAGACSSSGDDSAAAAPATTSPAVAATRPAAPPAQSPSTSIAPFIDEPLPPGKELAQKGYLHDGFRTPIEEVLIGSPALELEVTMVSFELAVPGEGAAGRREVAAINLGALIDNYVIFQTFDGEVRLYLRRDGTLRETPEEGEFVSYRFERGGPALAFRGPIDGVLSGTQYALNVSISTQELTPIRVVFRAHETDGA